MCILSNPHPGLEHPRQIGGTTCYWKLKEPENLSFVVRVQHPLPGRPDNSNYAPLLRPGVIVSESLESDPASETMTTLGVVGLRDKESNECYVAVAAHAFSHNGIVLHPGGAQRSIVGQLVTELSDTNIRLIKLAPGIEHTNRVFDVYGTLLRLRDLVKSSLRIGELLEMDSPFDGMVSGTIIADELMIIPNDPEVQTGNQWHWVRGHWNPFNSLRGWDATEGTCGTPVLLQDTGTMAGFFRYHNYESRMSYMIAASNLDIFFGGRWEVI